MEIEIIYPTLSKKTRAQANWMPIIQWSLGAAAYACPIINLCVGGKAWSLIVVWSIISLWSGVINRPLVENNRISRSVGALIYASVLMVLIELFLTSGWAVRVIPIVWFAMLVVIATFFLTDFQRQRQNIMPMLWVIIGSFVAFVSAVIVMPRLTWPMIVMACVAFAMLVVSAIVMRWGLWLEIKKRFHTN